MTITGFMRAAIDVGVDRSPLFLTLPETFGEALLVSAKRYAKFLEKQFPNIGHRRMLEVVAKAAGFPHWHAFHTIASRLKDEYAPRPGRPRPLAPDSAFQPFVNSLPLLIQVPEDVRPSASEQRGLERFGYRLAGTLPAPEAVILNVIAKLQGADTWSDLCNRNPENSSEPLYQFVIGDGGGEFHLSSVCYELLEEWHELSLAEDNVPFTKDKQLTSEFLKRVLQKRPDFLDGLAAQATLEEDEGDIQKAGLLYERAIQRAEALIPAGFNGQISWDIHENRFYLDLLYNYMCWCARDGKLIKAIALARRQLRFNPRDSKGVRITLPALLAANRNHRSAAVALRRLNIDWPDGQESFVQSLCHLAAGNRQTGLEWFLRALFEFPILRFMLVNERLPDDWRDRRWHRGALPDFDMFWFHYDVVRENHPELEQLYRSILSDPTTKVAEEQADRIYQSNIRKYDGVGHPDDYVRQQQALLQLAADWAARFGERLAVRRDSAFGEN